MTPQADALVGAAAFVASALNAGAGGGSFISFPALLAAGIPPVSANATNSTAMWLGSASSAGTLRAQIDVPRPALITLLAASAGGSVLGALLLLRTSNAAFAHAIPILLFAATVLFVAGPHLARVARTTRAEKSLRLEGPFGLAAQFAIAVYGGFFGAAIGILMLALFGLLGITDVRRANALKVLLSTIINGVAVVPFVVAHAIAWDAAVVACPCALAGGYFGAKVAKRLPPPVVRRFVIVVAGAMTMFFAFETYVFR